MRAPTLYSSYVNAVATTALAVAAASAMAPPMSAFQPNVLPLLRASTSMRGGLQGSSGRSLAVSPNAKRLAGVPRLRPTLELETSSSARVPGKVARWYDICRAKGPTALHATAQDSVGQADGAAPVQANKASPARVAFYLAVWYSLTIGYNIYNKATLNRVRLPWLLSTVQLGIGSLYIGFVWATGLRKAPKLSGANLRNIAPLAFLHTLAHIAAVVGLSVGALGYFQIVKVCSPHFKARFRPVKQAITFRQGLIVCALLQAPVGENV